jgi:ATP/maltotriose-dependent transcriptional regulator MalT
MLKQAHESAEDVGMSEVMASVEFGYATMARADGRLREARERCLRVAVVVDTATFVPQFRALLRSTLGLIDGELGDLDAARRFHTEAIELAVQTKDAPVLAQTLVGAADLALRRGDPAQAARLLSAAVAVRGSVDRSVADVDRIERSAREALGDPAYEDAYRAGGKVTMPTAAEAAGLGPTAPN